MFRISARTVLELGAELISSDVIACYELIKNAFDAASPTGAEIRFEITLRRNDYLKYRQRALGKAVPLNQIRSDIKKAFVRSAPEDSMHRFSALIDDSSDPNDFVAALDMAYATENRIVVADTGHGMSRRDLVDSYLVIGTPSRKRAIDAALRGGVTRQQRPPFLGEKGIGRLSAMRLGDRLRVETAQQMDEHLNLLAIDWSAFADLDAMLDDIDVTPERGGAKPTPEWTGTRLTIDALNADWTLDRVQRLAEYDFSRLTDFFSDVKRRPRIAIFWNDNRVPVGRMDRSLLSHAHASLKGHYRLTESGPTLELQLEALDLGFPHGREVEKKTLKLPDLEGAVVGKSATIPLSALYELGGFEFEAYWFNRRRLGAIDSIGDRNRVRELQRRWSGILLFRDGFRVLPYGEDSDDWLALDRRALGSTRYLLNKTQFVGRVATTRLGNPKLVDQTNREGLRVCPEQGALIEILQLAIQTHLRGFLSDVQDRYKGQPDDLTGVKTRISDLEKRAKAAFGQLRRTAPQASEIVHDLRQVFAEIKEFYDRAQRRIVAVEKEGRQMVHMAGVGLLVEVVAHELARSTENTLAALNALRGRNVPEDVGSLLRTLRSEMTSVSKRLRVLDPLSVSGRQRKEVFDIAALVADVLDGHKRQFDRHRIQLNVTLPPMPVRIRAVKGMIVQVLENLTSNSLYWLDLRGENEPDFVPTISLALQDDPLALSFEDNGRGVAVDNRERIFRSFFSLKEQSKRRGLGLYIARDCAEYHGGTLELDESVNPETGRLHRFVLTLPDTVRTLP